MATEWDDIMPPVQGDASPSFTDELASLMPPPKAEVQAENAWADMMPPSDPQAPSPAAQSFAKRYPAEQGRDQAVAQLQQAIREPSVQTKESFKELANTLPEWTPEQQSARRIAQKQSRDIAAVPTTRPTSAAEAFGTATTEAILPTAAGLAAGAAAGSAFAPGPGTIAVGLLGGIAGAIGGRTAQDYIYRKVMGEDVYQSYQHQRARMYEEHPVASFVGEVLPSLVAMRPDPKMLRASGQFLSTLAKSKSWAPAIKSNPTGFKALLATAFGAGTDVANEAVSQAMNGDFDASRMALSLLVGTISQQPTAYGKVLTGKAFTRVANKVAAMGDPAMDVIRFPSTGGFDRAAALSRASRKTLSAADVVRQEARRPYTKQGVFESGQRIMESDVPVPKADAPAEQPPPLPKQSTDAEARTAAPEAKTLADVESKFAKQDVEVEQAMKPQKQSFFDSLRSAVADVTAPIKSRLRKTAEGVDVAEKMVLANGSGSESLRQFESAKAQVYSHLATRKERSELGWFLQALRTKELAELQAAGKLKIAPEDTMLSPVTAKEADVYLRGLETEQPEKLARFQKAADAYWTAMRSQLDQLRAERIISEESYRWMIDNHKHYSPRKFVQYLDQATTGKRGLSVPDSGIKALDQGSDRAMMNNPAYLMADYMARTQRRVFKNRANIALAEYSSRPDNAVGAVRVEEGGKVPEGYEVIRAWQDGKAIDVALPKAMADAWVSGPDTLNRPAIEFLAKLSGTKQVKMFATGINPEFALSNMVRDIAYMWTRTGEYNPILPVGVGQVIADIGRVASDVAGKKGLYADYIKNGGGMEMLSGRKQIAPQGTFSEKAQSVFTLMNKFNEMSEMLTRVALYRRALKNGATPQHAAYIARNSINFSEGGSVVKVADKFMPYLNAGVQGTRGIVNALAFEGKARTAETMFKLAQVMTFAAGVAYWNRERFAQDWDDLDERTKTNNWIFFLTHTRIDRYGKERRAFLSIPKDQGQRIFSTIAEEWMDGSRTGRANWGRVQQSLKEFTPVSLSGATPPLAAALLAYFYNKDVWTGEDVWKGRKVESWGEATSRTPDVAVQLAAMSKRIGLHLSPDRAVAAFGKLVPRNPYTWATGVAADALMGNKDATERTFEHWAKLPGVRKFIRYAYPQTLTEEQEAKATAAGIDMNLPASVIKREIEKSERATGSERQVLQNKLDRIFEKARSGTGNKDEDVSALVNSVPPKHGKWLAERIAMKNKWLASQQRKTQNR